MSIRLQRELTKRKASVRRYGGDKSGAGGADPDYGIYLFGVFLIKRKDSGAEKYFVYEKFDDNDLCGTDGFLVLGTHGCQWDFGLIISGEKRGMVFDTDNEGAYSFVAHSFNEFYQNRLDCISDAERFMK